MYEFFSFLCLCVGKCVCLCMYLCMRVCCGCACGAFGQTCTQRVHACVPTRKQVRMHIVVCIICSGLHVTDTRHKLLMRW